MENALKVLSIERKGVGDSFIAGIFVSQADVENYVRLFISEDENFEIEEFSIFRMPTAHENGTYVYQILVIDSETYLIEKILDVGDFPEPYVDDYPNLPLRIILQANNATDAKEKCAKLLVARRQKRA